MPGTWRAIALSLFNEPSWPQHGKTDATKNQQGVGKEGLIAMNAENSRPGAETLPRGRFDRRMSVVLAGAVLLAFGSGWIAGRASNRAEIQRLQEARNDLIHDKDQLLQEKDKLLWAERRAVEDVERRMREQE
jgi:hypothetical protein